MVERRGGFHVPTLPGFSLGGGPPGAPALPEQLRHIVLPAGATILGLDVEPGDPLTLAGPVSPLPIQPLLWDADADARGPAMRAPDRGRFDFVPLDERFLRHAPGPADLVTLGGVERIAGAQVVVVRVRPVQYLPETRAFVYYPRLRYTLRFEEVDPDGPRTFDDARPADAVPVGRQLRRLVEHPSVVVVAGGLGPVEPPLQLVPSIPCVIITDNFAWPESMPREGAGPIDPTRSPTLNERGVALSGDLVAELERLARWKTARGTRARVVTVSEIVGQTAYGDFTAGGFARDLQEVLRNFVKFAHAEWGTEYLLLGGDVNVVPMRKLAYYVAQPWHAWDASRTPIDPANPVPPARKCTIGTNVAKLHLDPAIYGTSFPDPTEPLYTQGGARFEFRTDASVANPGWYYVAEEELAKSAGFTPLPAGEDSEYVVVVGPQADVDDDYYWLGPERAAPSDLYYASVAGPEYSKEGVHDFDPRGYGVYGQHRWDPTAQCEVALDGSFHLMPDVWVGRAPVESGAEAKTFVDKVLTYERLESPSGVEVNLSYLGRIIFGAAYWLYEHLYSQTIQTDFWDESAGPGTVPLPIELQPGRFQSVSGSSRLHVHLQTDVANQLAYANLPQDGPNYRLVARFPHAQIAVPYDPAASSTSAGWYFATDLTFQVQATAKATAFVVVLGLDTPIVPTTCFWEPVTVEGGASEKEHLRGALATFFPAFSEISRFYSDYFELAAPPSIQPLDAPTIRAAIDDGCHFLSLTGHGSPLGCCEVSRLTPFQNVDRYFIAYADSCSTASPDEGADSLGEMVLTQANGGVGYVGNTRMSAIGVGDDYELTFWCALRWFGRLGPAAGVRPPGPPAQLMTHNYIQTLYGDPEMPVWTGLPNEYQVVHQPSLAWGETLEVLVLHAGKPVAGQRVTLMGGWTSSTQPLAIWRVKETKASGKVSFKLPSAGTVTTLQVTIVPDEDAQQPGEHQSFKPYVGEVLVTG